MLMRAVLSTLILVALGIRPVSADDFGSPVPGQHIYDFANVFSAEEVQSLEAKAAHLEAVGVPTVIYVRQKQATPDQAQQEASDLMDAWHVASSPGAADGFVMLLDVSPTNQGTSQVGIKTGKSLATKLTSEQIRQLPGYLEQPAGGGGLAGGLGALMTALAEDVTGGEGFGSRVPGQHIYDQVGLLSRDQVQTLDTKAATLDALGAPTVVVLRHRGAEAQPAQQDAHNLMDAWGVESAPGARDGVTVVVDFTPDNQRAQLGIWLGSAHTDNGQITPAALQDILNKQILPTMQRGDVAGGVGVGLDALAQQLRQPAPASP